MGYDTGSLSFARYAVTGDAPTSVDEDLLKTLAGATITTGVGLPDEVEVGFCGGRHVLDTRFEHGRSVFNDALHVAVRTDTNKVPGDLKRAYQAMEEDALSAGNPSGFPTKQNKKDAKDTAGRRVDEEVRSGQHRRSKMTPLLWDLTTHTLYGPGGDSAREKLQDLFHRTLSLNLVPLSSGVLALRHLETAGKRREYEDLRPTKFADGPEGPGQEAEYPWVAKGPEAKDFLGNEFLLWLWHKAQVERDTVAGVSLFLDRALDLDCVYGQTGRDGLRGDGPGVMPEAIDALRSGKVPRKAGLIADADAGQFAFTLNAEAMSVGGLKLPPIEDADDARVLFEERVTLLRDFTQMLDGMFGEFLKVRVGGKWEPHRDAIRAWIKKGHSRTAARAA